MFRANHLEAVRKVLDYNSIDDMYDFRNSGIEDRNVEKITQIISEFEKTVSKETLGKIILMMQSLPPSTTVGEFVTAYGEAIRAI